MNLDEQNYYEVLGLDQSANTADIEAAYDAMRSLYAPGGEQPHPANFEIIQRAYEVLRDPGHRKFFDSILADVKPAILVQLRASAQEIALLGEPQMVYLLVEMQATGVDEPPVSPLNLCLVIDRSTSMQGDRMRQVKRALKLLLPKLSAADQLSVISFSDRAEVLLPARPIGNQQELLDWLDDIQASGGTEIYQGLLAGVTQLHQVDLQDYNNQLVLLTDGRTYGDEKDCLQLAGEAAAQGITINAFGMGADWDDAFLDALVEPSGGLVNYVDSPEKIVATLRQRLKSLGETHAQRISLRALWPHTIELLESFRLTPYAQVLQPEGDTIALGDLEGGQPLSFILAFSVKPQPITTRIRIPLLFSAELPGSTSQTFREQVELSLVAEPPPYNPPQEVVRAVRLLTLYHLHERAWQEAELGQTENAAERMRRLSTRLLEAGEPELAHQADFEAQQLARTGYLSLAGRKSLKYGTRALTRKTLQLGRDDSV